MNNRKFSKITELYNNKSINISLLYSDEYKNPILHYLFTLIFPTFKLYEQFSYFSTTKNISEFLIYNFFNIEINLDNPEIVYNNSTVILNDFISLENKYYNIFDIDKEFFINHTNNIKNNEIKTTINKITAITLNIIKTKIDFLDENEFKYNKIIYFFVLLEKIKNYPKKIQVETLTKNVKDPELIYKFIINNNSSYITNNITEFLILYPEKHIFKGYISKNRIKYLENPLTIKLQPKLISTYLKASLIYQNKFNIENLYILLKTIFIEKIFNTNNILKYKKVINNFIIEDKVLLKIILQRKFNISLINQMVKYIPIFKLSFKLALKLYLDSNQTDIFYKEILKSLVKQYSILKKELKEIKIINDDFKGLIEE